MPTDDLNEALDNAAETSHRRNRVGCASGLIVLENVEQSPSGEPFSDDCYTTLLHNRPSDQGLSGSNRSGKRSEDCYTNPLHVVRMHLVARDGRTGAFWPIGIIMTADSV